jgi:beta-phosphoglucomutase-like phosphatase (HAD superfamily)
MEIAVKIRPRRGRKAAAVVRDQLKDVNLRAKIEEVFPGIETGRRAGMVVVNVPDESSEAALKALRDHADVEYATPAAVRKPKARTRVY